MATPAGPATAAGAIEALRGRAGAAVSERTLAVLAAVPHGGAWRAGADTAVAEAGGRVVVRGDVLIAFFTSVTHAMACATTLMKTGADAPGALAIGIDHTSVRLDAGGNPVGDALEDLAAVSRLAARGQVLVAERVVPHVSSSRSTLVAKLRREDGRTVAVHEVAWHDKQRIGRTNLAPLMLGIGAIAAALLAVYAVQELQISNRDAEDVRKMLVELPIPRPDAGSPEERPASRQVRKTGTLTLLTTPSAEVAVKGKVLGTTPLFNVELAAGTHVLELRGPDGISRVLSAPIKTGDNTAFRLRLDELPMRTR